MGFNKIEKEILKAIVAYKDADMSLADAITKNRILENRGIAIARKDDGMYFLFFLRSKYSDTDGRNARGFLAELIALVNKLYNDRLLIDFPSSRGESLVIGKENVTRYKFDINTVDNGREFVILKKECIDWVDSNQQSIYHWANCTTELIPIEHLLFSNYHVSQDLVDLVNNDFKSEEQIRFEKQQRLTWISIAVATIIGLLGIFCK